MASKNNIQLNRTDMGDNEARPSERPPGHVSSTAEIDDLNIVDATDNSLGLTNVGDVPPDDWAADTGPTRSPEAGAKGVSTALADRDRAPDGHKIDFEK